MGSEKPPRHVSVALVFDADSHKLLMVSSRAHPGMWILPKGGIEEGESSGQAAVRESYEEAGTPPDLPAPKDDERLMMLNLEAGVGQNRGAVWHVHAIKVSEEAVAAQDDWPEKEERVREWVSPRECLKRIQDWTKDPSTSEDIISQGGAVIESRKSGKKSSSAKRDKKSGAMEMALRQFVELYGWDKGGDVPIGAPREGGPDPHDVQCER